MYYCDYYFTQSPHWAAKNNPLPTLCSVRGRAQVWQCAFSFCFGEECIGVRQSERLIIPGPLMGRFSLWMGGISHPAGPWMERSGLNRPCVIPAYSSSNASLVLRDRLQVQPFLKHKKVLVLQCLMSALADRHSWSTLVFTIIFLFSHKVWQCWMPGAKMKCQLIILEYYSLLCGVCYWACKNKTCSCSAALLRNPL